jgi:methionyl-tRNA formyltransferase
MLGHTKTGLTIFRPNDGLDEGPILLQKEVEIGPDDTLGSVYFDKIFPLGVEALLAGADLVLEGKAEEAAQDETRATYEGWVREPESRIDWAKPVDQVYNLIRGCNPAPGAWTTVEGDKLQIFDARKRAVRRFAEVKGKKIGQVVASGEGSFTILAAGGFIEVIRCKRGDGKKVAANDAGIKVGQVLGLMVPRRGTIG